MADPTLGRRCAVVGHPVAHSLSPAMHRRAYRELDLAWTYEAVDVEPGALPGFVSTLDDGWRALSVTAPHKRDALALAVDADDVSRTVGAANTLVRTPAGPVAHNTDVPGAVAALGERGVEAPITARILGAGATAASLCVALAGSGTRSVDLVVRDPARAEQTRAVAERVGLAVTVRALEAPFVDVVDLLVSTVPGDAFGARSHEVVASARAVFDVVYDPWPTALAAAAQEADRVVVSGLDLLAHQAALQVRLMTGADVAAGVLRDAALEELASR